ncbi:hypothetical protein R1sor_010729 [Riccia sorocarpa]|uniref:Uncharacterized protein n=1 Tax=Riccia sorocarpa TaxID=122646 RepID=A0ABD3HZ66_9MARC
MWDVSRQGYNRKRVKPEVEETTTAIAAPTTTTGSTDQSNSRSGACYPRKTRRTARTMANASSKTLQQQKQRKHRSQLLSGLDSQAWQFFSFPSWSSTRSDHSIDFITGGTGNLSLNRTISSHSWPGVVFNTHDEWVGETDSVVPAMANLSVKEQGQEAKVRGRSDQMASSSTSFRDGTTSWIPGSDVNEKFKLITIL